MYKGILSVVVIIGVLIFATPAEGVIIFERTYGGTDWDWGNSVQETQDGGYIIAGETGSFGAGNYDVYLIKTDSLGNTIWTKTYGGIEEDGGNSVQETQDGGYIIAGETGSFGAGYGDVWFIKTNVVGDTVWTKTYGDTLPDGGYSVQETQDGGYIIAGWTDFFGAGCVDVYLIKTDSLGNTVWTKTYGGTEDDWGYSVQETQDGGFIITGGTDSFGTGVRDVYLIKTNAVGDTVWTNIYGGISWDCGYSVQVTQDGGYIIAGATTSYGPGTPDRDNVYIIKTNAVGDTVWTKFYGGIEEDGGYSVQETQDGGYIIAGLTESFGAGYSDVWLIKTNAVGDTVWTKTYGGTDWDKGYSVQETQDGGYIIVGMTQSFGAGSGDVYLIKTDSLGNTGLEEESAVVIPELYGLFQNQPNPFNKVTSISYWVASQEQRVTLKVYDVAGKLVKTLVDERRDPGYYVCIWDGIDDAGKKVSNGIYFMRFNPGDYHEAKKLMIIR